MSKPYPALCKDCKHSEPERGSEWCLRCHHPRVNAKDSYALSCSKGNGTSCSTERGKIGFLSECGMSGKLWEPK